ncbi:Kidins220 [Symbiodinium sp. CCMP2456]|nr:Kidins220 [Symbiodinium sp. CCMP2456]
MTVIDWVQDYGGSLQDWVPNSDGSRDLLTGLPAAMKKLLVTVAALTPEASSAFIRQVALSEASGNRGLQPLDDDEREARDAEIEAERTVKEAEAALQERDEKPRHGKSQPLFATVAALRMEKGLPYTEFEPRCIKHMEEVSSSLADAYGDVQVKHLLTQECRLEAEFPRTVDTGFDDVKECLKFADEFAKREDGSFKQFCKHFFEASDLPADTQAIAKQTETAAKKTARSSWWDRAYRAPNVMRESTQDSSEVIGSAGTSKARARRGSTDKTTESAGKPKTAAEEGTATSRPEVGKSTEDAEGAGEDSAEDTGEAAYEAALRSGKSPEEAARVAAEAASKVAEDEARKSGKSPEEVQRAAAAAAYKAGVSNGMSKKEAEDASSEAAEDVSAKAARGIPGSSRGSDSGEGSAASTDTPATASAESQRDGASGAVAQQWGWFQWLWNLLWPVQTQSSEKPFNNTLGPAKNKTTEIGLQQSDLERLDAILRQERDFDADGIVANTDRKEYTSACVVHLKKVGTAIDSSYSDQQAQEVLESQCLLDKEFVTRHDSFVKTKDCKLFAKLYMKARRQELLGSDASYKKLCAWYFSYMDQAFDKDHLQDFDSMLLEGTRSSEVRHLRPQQTQSAD